MSKISCVICHYNPGQQRRLQNLVGLCVESLLSRGAEDVEIIVCDGSPEPDEHLRAQLTANPQVAYVHGGQRLSFGATYNLGIQWATGDVVTLIANDILISAEQIKRLAGELSNEVGCVIPYLTESDYATQARKPGRIPRRSYPSSMTLNVNVFQRNVLLEIGCVPESLMGAYNDMVIFQRLRTRGQHIVLKHVGKVVHIGRVTRHSYADTVRMQQDRAEAVALEPTIFTGATTKTRKNDWAWLFANQAQTRAARLLWRGIALLPWHVHQQRGLGFCAAWLEPFLTCSWRNYANALRATATRN